MYELVAVGLVTGLLAGREPGQGVGVVGQVIDGRGNVLGPGDFADDARGQAQPIALGHRQATLQVGQHEVGGAIASIVGSQQ